MSLKFFNQLEFSTLLFDTVFGLILFYSFDSLFGVHDVLTLVFYLFSMLILIHWWLIFKSTDDSFSEEVTDSAADIVFGIVYAIVLYYLVQSSRLPDFQVASIYMVGLFTLDLCWSAIWRFIGQWRTRSKERIKSMEAILNKGLILDAVFIAGYGSLYWARHSLMDWPYLAVYIGLYVVYIVLTFRTKILNIEIF